MISAECKMNIKKNFKVFNPAKIEKGNCNFYQNLARIQTFLVRNKISQVIIFISDFELGRVEFQSDSSKDLQFSLSILTELKL